MSNQTGTLPGPFEKNLERFYPYLLMLARKQSGGPWRAVLDPSDLVQQTLLDAQRGAGKFRGTTSGELAAWLRVILARRLADVQRSRDAGLVKANHECSLEAALAQSSLRLAGILADSALSPSQEAQRHETAVELAAALAQLPDSQQTALILQHWEGWPVTKIARHMNRSPAAVAGLIKRGLRRLRDLLPDR